MDEALDAPAGEQRLTRFLLAFTLIAAAHVSFASFATVWTSAIAFGLYRVAARHRNLENVVDRALALDRAYRGSGLLVRVVPLDDHPSGSVPIGRGHHGFGVLRLVAFPFELRGDGLRLEVEAGAQLRVVTHAAKFAGDIASLPLGTKLVLVRSLADVPNADEPITLVDPRIDLLGHLRSIRRRSRGQVTWIVAGAAVTLHVAWLGGLAMWLAMPVLAIVVLDQLVARGMLMWMLCSAEAR